MNNNHAGRTKVCPAGRLSILRLAAETPLAQVARRESRDEIPGTGQFAASKPGNLSCRVADAQYLARRSTPPASLGVEHKGVICPAGRLSIIA